MKQGALKYLTLCILYLNIQSVAKRSEANPCKAKKAERSKAKELSEAKQTPAEQLALQSRASGVQF